MSKQFVKLAADIVIANSTGKGFTTEQLTHMLKAVADTLEDLSGETGAPMAAALAAPAVKVPATWSVLSTSSTGPMRSSTPSTCRTWGRDSPPGQRRVTLPPTAPGLRWSSSST